MAEADEPTKEQLLKKLSSQSKDDLVSALSSKLTKDELTSLVGSRLKKEELVSIAEGSDDQTKEQLVRKLASRAKEEIASALSSKVTKDDLVSLLGSRLKKDELAEVAGTQDSSQGRKSDSQDKESRDDDGDTGKGRELSRRQTAGRERSEVERDESTDLDWNSELDWSPPPAPTPPPVTYAGAAPSMPGQRVRVDVSGLPMLGVFAGRGASAAGTITGVDARNRMVKVYLDAVFDGQKEIVVPPERITPDG
jgi:hypothetical protein